ncbi:MAG: hypothetical protein EOO74_11430 [Myxococcales bacterium]|nr:MAG: hypothetical protein EOO74_11430 [Myxococcales bacterium]
MGGDCVTKVRHWHVTVTVGGAAVEPLIMRAALQRLSAERPFLEEIRYTRHGAEVRFWDEGESMLDVASLALRLWSEHRDSANLPDWEVVGLEVVERPVQELRASPGSVGDQVMTFRPDVI